MVVHECTEKEFAATFVWGDVGNSLYIVDVKCIIAPLFVVWNESETGRVCMLPLLENGIGSLISVWKMSRHR